MSAIIHRDQSGLGAGIAGAGSILGQALQQRGQQQQQQRQIQQQQQQQQQFGTILQQTLGTLPEDASPMDMMRAISAAAGQGVPPAMLQQFGALYSSLQQSGAKRQAEEQKGVQQQQEAAILSKFQRGEDLTPQEMSLLSPTSVRSLIGLQKPQFEPTEEKLEAQRVSELATEIEKSYSGAVSEDRRLDRMEKLSESDKLTTPLMKKSLDALGLPLGVLNNPDSEEFAKLEADFLRDVRDVFPGGRITNFEIQSYLKTVPGLSNTKEGRQRVVNNRRLQNKAKKLKYDTYKEILKENRGRKPRNLSLLIEERIGDQLDTISEQFRDGITESVDKSAPTFQVTAPDGTIRMIPNSQLKAALDAGGKLL